MSTKKMGTYLSVPEDQFGANPEIVTPDRPLPVSDFWLEHAKQVIYDTYGDRVSITSKDKDLLKFGHSHTIGTSLATIAHQPTGILHETYLSDNLITHLISTSAADTGNITVEGHTISGGLFTFVVQTIPLTGQTAAALNTPLARITRLYNPGSVDFVGVISGTEVDTYTAGVPNTATKVHIQIEAGENQSEKAATALSNVDYLIVTGFFGDYLQKTAGFAEVILQVRHRGGVFRNQIRKACSDGSAAQHYFKPFYIVPKNADVRLVASADGANTSISGGIQGVLATVVT